MVRNALQQVSAGKNAYETAIGIEDGNGVNAFIQHDAGNFPNLCDGGGRNHSASHDFSQSPSGGLSLIGRRDKFRNVME